MPSFEFKPPAENKTPSKRVLFQSRLNDLLIAGAPLREMAEMLGAEQYVEGEAGKGIRFNVKAFADEQFGIEDKSGEGTKQKDIQHILPPERYQRVERVLLPPGSGEMVTGSGKGFEEKKSFPRDKAFVELLSEMDEPYSVISGIVQDNMMRRQSYKAFIIKNREKIFFINNEEGNATFVVHDAVANDWVGYAAKTKDELREEENIEVINYPGSLEDWKLLMHSALTVPKKELVEVGENDDVVEDPESIEESFDHKTLPKSQDEDRGDGEMEEENYRQVPQKERHEKAPEGWVTLNSLSKDLGISHYLILKEISQYRESNPEWLQEYLGVSKRIAEYYHPELVKKVIEGLKKIPDRAPDGWMTNRSVAKKLNKTHHWLSREVENYRTEHPEWFEIFLDVEKKCPREHYSPELIVVISKRLNQIGERAPDGWKTNKAVAGQVGRAKQTVKRVANEFRNSHPEWFREYVGVSDRKLEYYHPDLVANLIEIKRNLPGVAPDGWMTNGALFKQSGKSYDWIARQADRYRETNPEWFQGYLDGSRKVVEHYHPTLVAKIVEESKKLPEVAPDGWMTTKAVAGQVGRAKQIVKRIANEFRNSHPEWFEEFLEEVGKQKCVHYHPDLVIEITKEIERLREKGKLKSRN